MIIWFVNAVVPSVVVYFIDVSLEVGQSMLRWVYTDQSDIIHSADDTFVLSLLAVAKTYRLDPLANRQGLLYLSYLIMAVCRALL